MKIICDQCGAKYQIKADKVKNKPFKIRCKRCENAIVVRPEEVAKQNSNAKVVESQVSSSQASAQASVQESVQAPTQASEQWYIFINDQQQGPFTVDQLKQYWQELGTQQDLYVWSEGMAGWEVMTQIPRLQVIWGSSQSQNSAKNTQEQQAQEQSQQQAQQQVQQQVQPVMYHNEAHAHVHPQESHSSDDDLMASSAPVLESSEKDYKKIDTQALRNQRNENSVLFSLESLGAGGGEIKIHNKSNNSEASGLIDLAALSTDPTGGQAPINLTIGLPRQQTMVASSKSNALIIALSTVAAVVVSFAVIWTFFDLKLGAPQVNKTSSRTMVLGETKAKVVTANVVTAPKSPDVTTQASNEVKANPEMSQEADKVVPPKSEEEKKPKKVATQKKSKVRKKKRTRSRSTARKSSAKPKRRAPPPTSSSSSGDVDDILKGIKNDKRRRSSTSTPLPTASNNNSNRPKKPSKSNIKSTLRRANVKGCSSRDPSLRGTVKVRIYAVSSGAITRAQVVNDPFARTAVAACIEREVKRQRFESFRDSSIQFTFPYRL